MDAAADWRIQDGQYALNFSLGDYVTCGVNRFQNTLTNALTASCWIRPLGAQQPDYSPLSQFQSSTSRWMLWITPQVAAYINNSIVATGTSSVVTTGVWQHVAITLSGGVASVYYQGRREASGNLGGTISINTGELRIGDYFTERTILGMVDDVIMFNRGLTPTEMWRLYQLGRGGMLERRRRRRVYTEQAGFRGYYATQRAQLIGGGLR
jgi:hypothetical protein